MKTVLALAIALLAGCVDEDMPEPPDALPLCADLGCENAFCNAAGVCTCAGESCSMARPDAGISP